MIKKLPYLMAAGVGYVLGARAGRERYEQMRIQAQKFVRNPKVRNATHKAQDTVKAQASHAAEVAKEKAGTAAQKVRHGNGPSSTTTNGSTPGYYTPPEYQAGP